MKQISILITFLAAINMGFACPTGTISATDNGGGNYTFTLNLDYSGTQATSINYLKWDFGDGSSAVVPAVLISTGHQFPAAAAQSYTVKAIFSTSAFGTQAACTDTVSLSVSVAQVNAQITCPVAAVVPIKASDWCNTGTLTLNWAYCNEDYDQNGQPDNYWTANYVDWNMGDGTLITTQGTSAVTHSFQTASTVNIAGTAYFTGQNGETCATPVLHIPYGTGDPCLAVTNDTLQTYPYFAITPFYAKPDLYINPGTYCQTNTINFYDAGGIYPGSQSTQNWSYELFIDGSSVATGSGVPSSSSIYQSTLTSGDHLAELVYTYSDPSSGDSCTAVDVLVVAVDSCDTTCNGCTSFSPQAGSRYWLSAWVKEVHASQKITYLNSEIQLEFVGSGTSNDTLKPSGDVIEGWQRIVGSFTVPANTTDLKLHLKNTSTVTESFFDDVRIHPFNASMKSYVYDPVTLWLTAELDDNNYATFYEYDKEGQLIRIKKETARGIMTIQESRSSNPKE